MNHGTVQVHEPQKGYLRERQLHPHKAVVLEGD
jgi:hypothetical protein